MARPRSRKRASIRIDEAELAAFRAGMRRRYSNDEILEELRSVRKRVLEIASRDDRPTRIHQLTFMMHPLSRPLLLERGL